MQINKIPKIQKFYKPLTMLNSIKYYLTFKQLKKLIISEGLPTLFIQKKCRVC